MRLSASSGHYGYWDDDQAFVNDWGFELGEIAVPTTIWIAGRDLMVPPAHGRWLAEHVPGAQRLELPEEGHVSIFVRHIDDMVRRLAEDAGL
jgi:pimeloyl-ACP methyl ester carboxylesterase